jgi:hypothetical protein
MKKLEDIPKKNVFEAPEGYFDRLPGVIQARAAEGNRASSWAPVLRMSLRYALPALVIAAASFFYLTRATPLSTQDLIASVDSASLAAYLDDSDLSSDDLMESIPLDHDEADAIRDQTVDDVNMNDEDIEYLKDELGIDY